MKVSIEGKFKLGLTEVPDQLAKELEDKLKQINSSFANLKLTVEEDDEEKKNK